MDRDERQRKLEALPDSSREELNRLDDEYYALEGRTDLTAAMRSLLPQPEEA